MIKCRQNLTCMNLRPCIAQLKDLAKQSETTPPPPPTSQPSNTTSSHLPLHLTALSIVPQPSMEYNVSRYFITCTGTNPLDDPYDEATEGVNEALSYTLTIQTDYCR